jgi:hypothetical protein
VGRTVQVTAADAFVAGLMPVIDAIRKRGATTLEAMSQALNERGIRAARGGTHRRFPICSPAQRSLVLLSHKVAVVEAENQIIEEIQILARGGPDESRSGRR